MLAKLSHSARAGKIVRMFCKPAHGVNTPFTTHTSLDTLLKQIDGDKPMLYCLLITESWHPEYTQKAVDDLVKAKGMFQGIDVYHASSDVDTRINRYYTIRAHPAFFVALYGRHFVTHYGVDLRKLSEKIKAAVYFSHFSSYSDNRTLEYANTEDMLPETKTYKPLHVDFRQIHEDTHKENAWVYN